MQPLQYLVLGFAIGVLVGMVAMLLLPRRRGPFESATLAAVGGERRGAAYPLHPDAEDAIQLWTLIVRGERSSRQHLMQAGAMSAHRWNRASFVLEHLQLRPNRVSYQEGVDAICNYVATQQRLHAKSPRRYVSPT